jgi:hypothetical protein
MILKAKDKPYKISMFESGSVEGQYEVNNDGSYALNSDGSKKSTTMSKYLDAIMSNKTCEEYFTSISTHSYWSSTATKKAAAQYLCANYPNLSVACTEYCQMTNDENSGVFDLLNTLEGVDRNGYTIDFGIAMAKVMYDDLTILNATEWDWWTACSNGIYTDGLVYIDNSDHSNIKTSKRLWCLGNYSKFIDEGAVRVKITENQASILSSAYKNPDGSLVIVYINEGKSDMTVNINASGYKTYDTYVTDASRDLELYQSGTYSVKNNVTIPARSVTTVVLK